MTPIAILNDLQGTSHIVDTLNALLGKQGWTSAQSYDEAQSALARKTKDSANPIVILGLGSTEQPRIDSAVAFLRTIDRVSTKVLFLAPSDLSAAKVSLILRAGAADFLPLPVSRDELDDALRRLSVSSTGNAAPAQTQAPIFSFYHTIGGVGATTLATNVAWDLANRRKSGKTTCLIDLDLQYGAAASFLDLPRRDAVLELIANSESSDGASFSQATVKVDESFSVLTGANDVLPLTLVTPATLEKILDAACTAYDIVIVDLPVAMTEWTETILKRSSHLFLVTDASVRAAQGNLRFLKAMQAEELSIENVSLLLNRAPKLTNFAERSKAKAMARSLKMKIFAEFADGEAAVREASDQGMAIRASSRRNPLSKSIKRFADALVKEMG